jgi:hypothetical protein
MRTQLGRPPTNTNPNKMPHLVSEEIDKMRDELQHMIGGQGPKTQVKLSRSRSETRVTFIFKGGLEDTEERLQKIYKGLKDQL